MRRAQEIADGLKQRRAELLADLQQRGAHARGPILLDAHRRPGRGVIFGVPDDTG
ncbi:MAG TPA: hypothetical protein VGX96_11845 [Candidatus Elarobacter sp.]|nr:hypothetical protein [Candidatus Elarobacter sp.]